jgi:sulfate permease, SulP family
MTHRYAPVTSAPKLRALPFTGLRSAFADGYGARDLRADVLAGLVVGVVALPLSMALAIAVGVPPQHGLYTAIVAGLISYLPMAALAALLILVAWNMSEAKHFFHMIRVAPKSDVAVLLTCYFLTVVFDMVIAVTAGMVLAAFLFMRRMAEVASVQLVEEGHPHLKVKLPKDTVLYEVNGPLFFGAAEMAMDAFKAIGARMRVLILYMAAVPAMDITGLVALESALLRLRQQGVLTLITGLRPQPEGVLKKAGVQEEPGRVQFCATLEEAADAAAAHLGRPVFAHGS